VATPAAAAALLRLHEAVQQAGGDLRITESHRDVAVQASARRRYDLWVLAGKPRRTDPRFNAETMRSVFVAKPGRSFHNGGRAIDLDLASLRFPRTSRSKIVDRLWEIALPLGWEPVIRAPDERADEAWHLDYLGPLRAVRDRLGYEQAARCGAILVGHGDDDSYAALVQALLVLMGHDIGAIDGIAGPRTSAAMAAALGIGREEVALLLREEAHGAVDDLVSRAPIDLL
jgi:hypothetical protein